MSISYESRAVGKSMIILRCTSRSKFIPTTTKILKIWRGYFLDRLRARYQLSYFCITILHSSTLFMECFVLSIYFVHLAKKTTETIKDKAIQMVTPKTEVSSSATTSNN